VTNPYAVNISSGDQLQAQSMNPGEITLRLADDETDLTVAESRRLRKALLKAEKDAAS
jgi:hypothetical protein